MQNTLNQVLNLSLPVDGLMGTTTRSAVRSFQEKQGLPVDGIVGPETEQALRDASGDQLPAESTSEPSEPAPPAEEPAGESFEFFDFEEETGTAYRPTLRSGSRGEAVTDLQSRLQRAGHDPGPLDGIFGSRTDAAVRSFQRAQSITVDGIVGPQTWGRLLGTAPGTPSSGVPSTPPTPTQVDTPLPASGSGFYSYTSADKRYGTLDTIKAMQAISVAWNRAHRGGPRIGIGNISKRGGGSFPPHSTHREGLNVDIRPVRNDNSEEAVTYKDATYSRTLTQDLVNLIYANPVLTVSSILFNDPGVQRVKPYTGHDNHVHVTFNADAPTVRPTPSPVYEDLPAAWSNGPVNAPAWLPKMVSHDSITCSSREIPAGLRPESVTQGWTARTQAIVNIIRGPLFGWKNVGGGATGDQTGHIIGSYHYCGRAIDSFAPGVLWKTRATGTGLSASWRLANWAAHNAAALNVSEVIFYDLIWTAAKGGWRPYRNSGLSEKPDEENSLQHRDHVHISVY